MARESVTHDDARHYAWELALAMTVAEPEP